MSSGQPQTPARRIARSGQVSVVVDAPADAVWRVVADVTRTGEWSHECQQVTPAHELAWRTISTPLYPDSTEWSLRVEAEGPRTRITQTYRVTRLPALLDWLFTRAVPAHIDRTAGLAEDLHRLGAVAAADAVQASRPAPGRVP